MNFKVYINMFFLFAFIGTYGRVLHAQHQSENLRELCRKRIAGQYLNYWNNLDKSKQLYAITKSNESKAKEAIDQLKNEINALRESTKYKQLDHEAMKQENDKKILLTSLEESYLQFSKILEQQKSSLSQNQMMEENFRTKIGGLFEIKKIPAKDHEIFNVVYKSKCPKHRVQCALSRKDAHMLLEIFADLQTPSECQKYASYLGY